MQIALIKAKIQKLYETNPNVHMNINLSSPKLTIRNAPVVIKGVYPHIFQIEETDHGYAVCHSLQYVDILIKRVEIPELGSFNL